MREYLLASQGLITECRFPGRRSLFRFVGFGVHVSNVILEDIALCWRDILEDLVALERESGAYNRTQGRTPGNVDYVIGRHEVGLGENSLGIRNREGNVSGVVKRYPALSDLNNMRRRHILRPEAEYDFAEERKRVGRSPAISLFIWLVRGSDYGNAG